MSRYDDVHELREMMDSAVIEICTAQMMGYEERAAAYKEILYGGIDILARAAVEEDKNMEISKFIEMWKDTGSKHPVDEYIARLTQAE